MNCGKGFAGILFAILCVGHLCSMARAHAEELEGYGSTAILRRPHLKIEYYWLDAVDLPGLRAQLAERGPRDLGGVARDAYVGWKVRWTWPRVPSGGYDLAGARCSYEITATLPKWKPIGGSENTTPKLRAKWKRFTTALAVHELGHIEMVERRFAEPCEAIRAELRVTPHLSTAHAHAIAKGSLAALRLEDRRYDEITDHGRTQGARLVVDPSRNRERRGW